MHGARLTRTPRRNWPRGRRFRHNRMRIDRLVGTGSAVPPWPLRTHPPLSVANPVAAGGGISGGLLGIDSPFAVPARATGAGGASTPPFTGRTACPCRAGVERPTDGAEEDAGIRPATAGPAAAPVSTAGATGAGRSSGRSTPGTDLGAAGVVAGPAAAGGTTGLGGGGGATTALRAVALMSAIERVSGWRSDLKSCNFFRSSPACTCGASTVGAGEHRRGRSLLHLFSGRSTIGTEMRPDFVGEVIIECTGMRLLIGNTQFPQVLQNHIALHFQFTRQFVDPNLPHA